MKESTKFLSITHRHGLVALMVLHAVLLAYGASIHGPGWDEVGHLPAGISHWQLGNTDLYRVNPPLIRMAATLPISAMDAKLGWVWNTQDTIARPEWDMGSEFFRQHGRDAYWYLTIARWATIPWSLLAMRVIFRWGEELYGVEAGLFSSALWCFSPLVLANAQMITPDTGSAALGAAASYVFWKWLQSGSIADGFQSGLLLGLAELAKFTWVILFMLWPIVWCVSLIRNRQEKPLKGVGRQTLHFVGIFVLALWVINIGYGLEGSFQRLGDFDFVSKTLRGEVDEEETPAAITNRFAGTLLGSIPVPLPRNYVLGIDRQKLDFEAEFPSYLRGQWRNRGWWYYYAYAVSVKEPMGYLVLFLLAISISIRRAMSCREIHWSEVFLLAPAVVVFGLVSSQIGFNHHVRYVLPAFPFVFIWMGKIVVALKSNVEGRVLVGMLFGTAIISSLWIFPHSHAYFNLAAGGPLRGHDHLLDSNIDWGQDILMLANWIEEHPEKTIDGVAYSLDHLIDRESIGISIANPPAGSLSRELGAEGERQFGPQPGRYAVFVRPLREHHRRYEYFRFFEPVEVLGYTVYIYEISEQDCLRYRRRAKLS